MMIEINPELLVVGPRIDLRHLPDGQLEIIGEGGLLEISHDVWQDVACLSVCRELSSEPKLAEGLKKMAEEDRWQVGSILRRPKNQLDFQIEGTPEETDLRALSREELEGITAVRGGNINPAASQEALCLRGCRKSSSEPKLAEGLKKMAEEDRWQVGLFIGAVSSPETKLTQKVGLGSLADEQLQGLVRIGRGGGVSIPVIENVIALLVCRRSLDLQAMAEEDRWEIDLPLPVARQICP